MPDFSAFDTYIDTHSDRFIQRLRNLVRIPNVSGPRRTGHAPRRRRRLAEGLGLGTGFF
ncbi:MAG: hypothetical protein KBG20_13245 [Caldilineaceae bacterium]|nr:hypothetical protein [Caldilineaceae bacterium]MBP8108655.1 hypothetical protein [Caldilineaceae bacterium]MBP8123208.1 hypothetical protein [Caldilineaceae bacterium]MBP9073263.1 hypothetical protein [Caldilineaceae bacterium]